MKSIRARAIWIIAFSFWVLIVISLTAQAQSVEYYIYRDSKGGLVLSNQKPPPGSEIIKQQNMPDLTDGETPQLEERNGQRPNGDAKTPKPTQNR